MFLSPELEKKIKFTSEKLLGELYAEFKGQGFESIHTGDQNDTADCLITKNGEPQIVLEISADRDEEVEMAQSHIDFIGHTQVFNKACFGTWSLNLPVGKAAKEFSPSKIEQICEELNQAFLSCDCPTHAVSCKTIRGLIKSNNLISAKKVSDDGASAFLYLPSNGIQIDQNPNLINEYIEAYFKSIRETKLKNLISRSIGLENHFMIEIGSGTNQSIFFRMVFDESSEFSSLPTYKPCLPDEIHGVSLVCFGSGRLLHFDYSAGWQLFEPVQEKWSMHWQREMANIGHPLYQFARE